MQQIPGFFLPSQFPNQMHENESNRSSAIMEICKLLKPLTLPNLDSNGYTNQLWKFGKCLVGSVLNSQGHIKIISSCKIINPCGLQGKIDDHLVERLEKISMRWWSLIFDPCRKKNTERAHNNSE